MQLKAPDFWYGSGGLLPTILSPVGAVYGLAGRLHRQFSTEQPAPIPVLCIGNVVAGGAGKTPVAISVAERLKAQGVAVHFLSRGYGGTEAGPLLVDPNQHSAADVGDEPLLLSASAPAWISRDRPAGARAAAEAGADIIVMDDGFQNPSLRKDCSIIAIDGNAGFGNGLLMPAGPLRELPATALMRAEGAVIIGRDSFNMSSRLEEATSGRVAILRAQLVPGPEIETLKQSPLVAFAGIARPSKFFGTLVDAGCRLVDAKSFGDHHLFSEADLAGLRRAANNANATLVTTAKDYVRLPPSQRNGIEVLSIRLEWEDAAPLDALLQKLIGEAA